VKTISASKLPNAFGNRLASRLPSTSSLPGLIYLRRSRTISGPFLDLPKRLSVPSTKASMGRPKPSQDVLDFAVAFACAVTAQSASICDFVARSGDFSLYALLGRLAPKVRTAQ
jgi:hypothetical protein